MVMGEFYVYVMFLPNGSPCYVGKGTAGRWLTRDRSYNRRLSKAIEIFGALPVVKIRAGLSEDEAFDAEVAIIAALGRGRNGPLMNITPGGRGIRCDGESEPVDPAKRKRNATRNARLRRIDRIAKSIPVGDIGAALEAELHEMPGASRAFHIKAVLSRMGEFADRRLAVATVASRMKIAA